MAATLTVKQSVGLGNSLTLYTGTITFDNSYPTGGEAIDATGDIGYLSLIPGPSAGYVFEWDEANQKIKAYRQKDPGNAGGADIALPEVAATTDLSAVSTDFIAVSVS